jgi:hypothetical protein
MNMAGREYLDDDARRDFNVMLLSGKYLRSFGFFSRRLYKTKYQEAVKLHLDNCLRVSAWIHEGRITELLRASMIEPWQKEEQVLRDLSYGRISRRSGTRSRR